MRTRRKTYLQRRPWPAPTAGGQLLNLDDDSLAAILSVADGQDVAELASACMRLCRLARACIPTSIITTLPGYTDTDSLLETQGPPFCGCTKLTLHIEPAALFGERYPGVLWRVQDWCLLQSVHLIGAYQFEDRRGHADCKWLLPGLYALRSLGALRSLRISVHGFDSTAAAAVGRLTQLSQLEVHNSLTNRLDRDEPGVAAAAAAAAVDQPVDISPWARLINLHQLTVYSLAVAPPSSLSAMDGLPTSLQELHVAYTPGQAYWVQQLKGLRHLSSLRMAYDADYCDHPSCHPAAVVQAAADHCPILAHLYLCVDPPESMYGFKWEGSLPLLPVAAVPPAPSTWCFDTALASLTHLVTLNCLSMIHISQPTHWDRLCQLQQLTQLHDARITCAPAAGQRLPALRDLQAGVTLPRADLVALLTSTMPALEELFLLVDTCGLRVEDDAVQDGMQLQQQQQQEEEEEEAAEQEEEEEEAAEQQQEVDRGDGHDLQQQQQQQEQAEPGVTMHALKTATLLYGQENGEAPSAAAVAAHCAAFLPVLGQVADLSLLASMKGEEGPWLPSLDHLTGLTRLRLGSFDPEHSLQVEDLVGLLQPVKQQLQELRLSKFASINPRVVLALQHELGALRELWLEGVGLLATADDPRSEEQLLLQLQRCVRPGLRLMVHDSAGS